MEMGQALPPHAVSAAFGKYISALPIVVPVDLHENAPCLKNTHSLISDFSLFREAEPDDIHWRAAILERQCPHLPQTRMPAVRREQKRGESRQSVKVCVPRGGRRIIKKKKITRRKRKNR